MVRSFPNPTKFKFSGFILCYESKRGGKHVGRQQFQFSHQTVQLGQKQGLSLWCCTRRRRLWRSRQKLGFKAGFSDEVVWTCMDWTRNRLKSGFNWMHRKSCTELQQKKSWVFESRLVVRRFHTVPYSSIHSYRQKIHVAYPQNLGTQKNKSYRKWLNLFVYIHIYTNPAGMWIWFWVSEPFVLGSTSEWLSENRE